MLLRCYPNYSLIKSRLQLPLKKESEITTRLTLNGANEASDAIFNATIEK